MRWRTGIVVALPLLLVSVHARGQMTEEEIAAEQSKADAEVDVFASETNEACKSKLKASIAWDTFGDGEWRKYNVPSFCRAPFDVLQKFCAGKHAAKYIRAKVRAIRCAYGGKGQRALTVSKGYLELRVDFDATDYDAFVRQKLLEQL